MVKQVPAPTPGRTVLFKDKVGTWPAVVRSVNPDNPQIVTLVVLTALAGAYLGKVATRCPYGENKESHWWWPPKSDVMMEVEA